MAVSSPFLWQFLQLSDLSYCLPEHSFVLEVLFAITHTECSSARFSASFEGTLEFEEAVSAVLDLRALTVAYLLLDYQLFGRFRYRHSALLNLLLLL